MGLPKVSGVVTATVLPFDEAGAIDWPSFSRVLAYCAKPEHVAAVFVNGHAGEGASLSAQERVAVIRFARETLGAGKPVMAGVLANSTGEAIALAGEARDAGADCAVLFPPAAFQGVTATPPAGPVAFVEAVARAVDLPLAIFQYPLASGFGYNTETLVALARIPSVCMIKEGSGDPTVYDENVRRLRSAAPQVSILATNAGWLMAQTSIGGDGIVSGLASLAPRWLADLWRAVEAGDLRAMRAANDRIQPLVRSIYAPPRGDAHTRMKVALQHLGLMRHAGPRGPLLPIEAAAADRVRRAIDESGLQA